MPHSSPGSYVGKVFLVKKFSKQNSGILRGENDQEYNSFSLITTNTNWSSIFVFYFRKPKGITPGMVPFRILLCKITLAESFNAILNNNGCKAKESRSPGERLRSLSSSNRDLFFLWMNPGMKLCKPEWQQIVLRSPPKFYFPSSVSKMKKSIKNLGSPCWFFQFIIILCLKNYTISTKRLNPSAA